MLMLGASLFAIGSCSNGNERSADAAVKMDSASVAERAQDELTLSILEDKKLAAEQTAVTATSNTKEAKRIERDAIDAADQADQAFRTEAAAQQSRQHADDQAARSNKASNKSDKNQIEK